MVTSIAHQKDSRECALIACMTIQFHWIDWLIFRSFGGKPIELAGHTFKSLPFWYPFKVPLLRDFLKAVKDSWHINCSDVRLRCIFDRILFSYQWQKYKSWIIPRWMQLYLSVIDVSSFYDMIINNNVDRVRI